MYTQSLMTILRKPPNPVKLVMHTRIHRPQAETGSKYIIHSLFIDINRQPAMPNAAHTLYYHGG